MNYENLGSFYLGRKLDPATLADTPDLLLYDSRDLTTHAVCVGMTGSGKTGLGVALLEEAAIDGVPAIVIDPKGDLGNLLLTFPQLRAEDFAPWVDTGEAARKGLTNEAFAAATAESWRKGLAQWDQDMARIGRLRDAVEVTVYTPGSNAGRSLSVLKSFVAPTAEQLSDTNALRERIGATVSGLLGLISVDADPLQSREHILLSTLLNEAWSTGRDLDLVGLIQQIQKPPFDKVGVFELDTFFAAKERLQLAMALNNLLAAPGFAAWREGEPLDIQSLLYSAAGKPRVAIISIAHLNDAERMFVVTLLLAEVVAWMRKQSGTSSLRALLYMDEITGYFPPTAMPPSKPPLLTLMKQARAFGVGVVLATQNPVDLDYKGLSNAGTWFIGRLQTERDKARVVEGLLGAAGGADKSQIEALLAHLGNRVFLMHNVHEDAPTVFRTRWALSYLRGPMTLQEIARAQVALPAAADTTKRTSPQRAAEQTTSKPVVPSGVEEYYLRSDGAAVTYTAHVLAVVRAHFIDRTANVDAWQTYSYMAPVRDDGQRPDWDAASIAGDLTQTLLTTPPAAAQYASVPAALLKPENYKSWQRDFEAHVFEHTTLTVLRCVQAEAISKPGSTEAEFRAQVSLALRERRDAQIDKLRQKYAPRLTTLQDQVRRAQDRIERERSQLSQQKMQTAISVGTSLLGALFGRQKINASSISRIGNAARNAGRIGSESEDVTRAQDSLEVLQQRKTDLDNELEQEVSRLQGEFDPANATIDRVAIKARKTDLETQLFGLAWRAE